MGHFLASKTLNRSSSGAKCWVSPGFLDRTSEKWVKHEPHVPERRQYLKKAFWGLPNPPDPPVFDQYLREN